MPLAPCQPHNDISGGGKAQAKDVDGARDPGPFQPGNLLGVSGPSPAKWE